MPQDTLHDYRPDPEFKIRSHLNPGVNSSEDFAIPESAQKAEGLLSDFHQQFYDDLKINDSFFEPSLYPPEEEPPPEEDAGDSLSLEEAEKNKKEAEEKLAKAQEDRETAYNNKYEAQRKLSEDEPEDENNRALRKFSRAERKYEDADERFFQATLEKEDADEEYIKAKEREEAKASEPEPEETPAWSDLDFPNKSDFIKSLSWDQLIEEAKKFFSDKDKPSGDPKELKATEWHADYAGFFPYIEAMYRMLPDYAKIKSYFVDNSAVTVDSVPKILDDPDIGRKIIWGFVAFRFAYINSMLKKLKEGATFKVGDEEETIEGLDIVHKAAPGVEVNSGYDLTLGGSDDVAAAFELYRSFRNIWDVEPATIFDANVFCREWMVVKDETLSPSSASGKDYSLQIQAFEFLSDIYSLVAIRRHTSDIEWAAFVDAVKRDVNIHRLKNYCHQDVEITDILAEQLRESEIPLFRRFDLAGEIYDKQYVDALVVRARDVFTELSESTIAGKLKRQGLTIKQDAAGLEIALARYKDKILRIMSLAYLELMAKQRDMEKEIKDSPEYQGSFTWYQNNRNGSVVSFEAPLNPEGMLLFIEKSSLLLSETALFRNEVFNTQGALWSLVGDERRTPLSNANIYHRLQSFNEQIAEAIKEVRMLLLEVKAVKVMVDQASHQKSQVDIDLTQEAQDDLNRAIARRDRAEQRLERRKSRRDRVLRRLDDLPNDGNLQREKDRIHSKGYSASKADYGKYQRHLRLKKLRKIDEQKRELRQEIDGFEIPISEAETKLEDTRIKENEARINYENAKSLDAVGDTPLFTDIQEVMLSIDEPLVGFYRPYKYDLRLETQLTEILGMLDKDKAVNDRIDAFGILFPDNTPPDQEDIDALKAETAIVKIFDEFVNTLIKIRRGLADYEKTTPEENITKAKEAAQAAIEALAEYKDIEGRRTAEVKYGLKAEQDAKYSETPLYNEDADIWNLRQLTHSLLWLAAAVNKRLRKVLSRGPLELLVKNVALPKTDLEDIVEIIEEEIEEPIQEEIEEEIIEEEIEEKVEEEIEEEIEEKVEEEIEEEIEEKVEEEIEPDPEPTPIDDTTVVGDPVDVVTGRVCDQEVDISFPRPFSLNLIRTYSSALSGQQGASGRGWFSLADIKLTLLEDGILCHDPEGRTLTFPALDSGSSATHEEGHILSREQSEFNLSANGLVYTFRLDHKTREAAPRLIVNGEGFWITFEYHDGKLRNLIDARGNTYRAAWNEEGLLKSLSLDLEGEVIPLRKYHYNKNGCLTRVEDEFSNPWIYEYDEYDRMIAKTDQNGYSFKYEYNEAGQCVKTWGHENAYYRRLKYYPSERKTEVYDYDGNKRVFEWNDAGLITSVSNQLGEMKQFSFADDLSLVGRMSEDGAVTSFQYEDGKVVKIDPENNKWISEDFENKIKKTDPLGNVAVETYDAAGDLIALEDQETSNRLKHDEHGKPLRKLKVSSQWEKTEEGKRIETLQTEDAMGNIANYQYDAAGNLMKITDALGYETLFEYNLKRQLVKSIDALGNAAEYEYDPKGNIIRTVDPMGGEENFEFKAFEKFTSRRNGNGDQALFNYNREGLLAAVVNENGETHSFQYDVSNQMIREEKFDKSSTSYNYSPAGEVSEALESDGSVIKFTYDKTGNILSKEGVSPDGEKSRISFSYDDAGRMLEAENENGSLLFEYDSLGRVVRETRGNAFIEKEYDRDGNQTKRSCSFGSEVMFEYDANGNLSKMETAGQTAEYVRDQLGRVIQSSAPGDVISKTTYDPVGDIVSQNITGPEKIASREYFRDANRKLVELRDQFRGDRKFEYDKGGRLLKAWGGDIPTEEFGYDPAGAIVEKNKVKALMSSGNRMESFGDSSFIYDERGNLIRETTGDETISYRYNAFNWLIEISLPRGIKVEYQYDALARRISQKATGGKNGETETIFYWDQRLLAGEESGGATGEYIFYPEQSVPLAQIKDGACLFYHVNHLGVPMEITDSRGNKVWSASYQSYGAAEIHKKSAFHNNLRSQGHYFDQESGLHYALYRYYSPERGFYLSGDPRDFIKKELNLYRRAKNDPVNNV